MRSLIALLAGVLAVWASPLAGLVAAGGRLAPFVHFPPRTAYVPHAPFSWAAFALFSLPAIAAVVAILWALRRSSASPAGSRRASWPWWLWLGLAGMAAGWFAAWTRGVVAAPWQRQSFTLLWSGYIVVANALAYRRSGRSLLTHQPALLAALFPVSAVFWWLFEHLNQFSANWHYSGVEAAGAFDYFLQASVPFSTVLPAVASTWAWLRTWPRFRGLQLPLRHGHRLRPWVAAATGALLLAALPQWPDALFPALWLAPLLVFAGLQPLVARRTFDWSCVLQPAIAALVCGFFWELWNYGAVARWEYSVPLVQRFHLFEMPLLGYAGYLPFGVECALVIDLVARSIVRRGATELL